MLLENENIKLRAPELSDLDFLFDMENNTEYWHLSDTRSPFSRFDLEQYILMADKDIYKTGQLRFIIVDKKDMPIGIIDMFDFDPQNSRAGVGIIIVEQERKNGYAEEALIALIDYSINILNLHQLFCNIEAGNEASINLFEKIGFRKTGIKKEWNKSSDKWIDELFLQKIFKTK
ncbi:MAG: GNAT family N-acetyltransferase [Chlorobi bacterium]|nr:GNAT family N-acetyltransferase [Chlorobiota bacterium]